ncbi:hypothetical protein BT96DRAFT_596459 [Gymnopus androsaceus JB14]|uniref:Uncharacterized protein n=1 Tax=Gymnopus androsaceus JB14 TaxID=1447944 RepID=A0A6A4GJF1_9AGAR|nr:hypothetical protein BT96DRAFT_596459 [Gymnopus androsaceus JB14]
MEVKAKMPKGDWLWPTIWMLPVNNIRNVTDEWWDRYYQIPRQRSSLCFLWVQLRSRISQLGTYYIC